MKIYESSRRILNPNLKLDEWQRELDSSRILSISSFLDNTANSFSNACMIYAPDHKSISWELDDNDIAAAVHI